MSNQNKPVQQQQQPNHTIKTTHTQFKGEIVQTNYPPPDWVERYGQIDASFPQQMFDMAKAEGEHRRWADRFILRSSLFLDVLGTIAGLAGVCGILFVGLLFMKSDHATEGATLIGTVTVALAAVFMTRGRSKRSSEK
jgi:uncharacterized membrane protein